MFYESRLDCPPVTPAWEPVLRRFVEGDAAEAFRLGGDLVRDGRPESPNDTLLWGDVLRAMGRESDFHKTILRRAREDEDPLLRLQAARVLSMTGRLLAADRLLETLGGGTLAAPGPVLVEALRCCNLAQMQRSQRALDAIDALERAGEAVHPWAIYELAYGLFCLRRWERALALFERVAAACPKWCRPATFAAQCLLCLGREREAGEKLAELLERFPREWCLWIERITQLASADDWASIAELTREAGDHLEAGSELRQAALHLQVRALWRTSRREEACALAGTLDPALAERLAPGRDGRSRRIAVRPLVQDRFMCVSTSVAMILRLRHQTADPAQLFREMNGQTGVADWQLDRWLVSHGLTPVDVHARPESIRATIDAGHPLLATSVGLIASHMQLVVGYDDGAREIEIIDPAFGLPVFERYEELPRAFSSLVAVLGPGEAIDGIHLNEAASAARRVRRAVYAGDAPATDAALAQLPATSVHRLRLVLELHDVLFSDDDVMSAAAALVAHEEASPELRLGAALTLLGGERTEEAERGFAALAKELPPFFSMFWRLHKDRVARRWSRMLRRTTVLVERNASLEEFWFLHGAALRACGRFHEAEGAIDVCLEISPHHLSAWLARLVVGPRAPDPAERRAVIAHLRGANPLCSDLVLHAADLEFRLGRVTEAEAILRDGIARLPCATQLVERLARWLACQGRDDLVRQLPGREAGPPQASVGDVSPDTPFDALVERAWGECVACEKGKALALLDERHARGELGPDEKLRRHQVKLGVLSCQEAPSYAAAQIDDALPSDLPHPRVDSLAWFLDGIRVPPAHSKTARIVCDWIDRMIPPAEHNPTVRFWRARYGETAGEHRGSVPVYRQLAETGFDGALYRLGEIASAHGLHHEALAWFRKQLEAVPGDIDGWLHLGRTGQALGDSSIEDEALSRLVGILPYDQRRADGLLNHWIETGRASQTREWVERNGSRYTADWREFWRIRCLVEEKRWDEVRGEISPEFRKRRPRDACWFERRMLDEQGATGEDLRGLDDALQASPDDPYLRFLKASQQKKRNRLAAAETLAVILVEAPHADVASEYLDCVPREQWIARIEGMLLAKESAPGRRGALAGASLQALSSRGADSGELFSMICRVRDAHEDDLHVLSTVVSFGTWAGKLDDLARHAWALHDADPCNPGYLVTAARAIVRIEAAKGFQMFDRHFEVTGDPESLMLKAECRLEAGLLLDGLADYRRVLQVHPGHAAAIAGLVHFRDALAPLHANVVEALRYPASARQRTFCTAAVLVAAAARTPLPASWETAAVTRLHTIRILADGFGDEDNTLQAMLLAWCRKRADDACLAPFGLGCWSRFKLWLCALGNDWGWNGSWIAKG